MTFVAKMSSARIPILQKDKEKKFYNLTYVSRVFCNMTFVAKIIAA